MEKYELEVRCLNCGKKNTLEIDKGVEFHDTGVMHTPSRQGEYICSCPNCGCARLVRL